MNAREVLEVMIRTNRGSMTVWSPAEVRHALDAYRAEVRTEVLREAIEAARSEYLHDQTGDPEDEAYNRGVTDAAAAIGALLETAGKDSLPADSTQPWEDESLPPQLREALRIMGRRGKVVELTAPAAAKETRS